MLDNQLNLSGFTDIGNEDDFLSIDKILDSSVGGFNIGLFDEENNNSDRSQDYILQDNIQKIMSSGSHIHSLFDLDNLSNKVNEGWGVKYDLNADSSRAFSTVAQFTNKLVDCCIRVKSNQDKKVATKQVGLLIETLKLRMGEWLTEHPILQKFTPQKKILKSRKEGEKMKKTPLNLDERFPAEFSKKAFIIWSDCHKIYLRGKQSKLMKLAGGADELSISNFVLKRLGINYHFIIKTSQKDRIFEIYIKFSDVREDLILTYTGDLFKGVEDLLVYQIIKKFDPDLIAKFSHNLSKEYLERLEAISKIVEEEERECSKYSIEETPDKLIQPYVEVTDTLRKLVVSKPYNYDEISEFTVKLKIPHLKHLIQEVLQMFFLVEVVFVEKNNNVIVTHNGFELMISKHYPKVSKAYKGIRDRLLSFLEKTELEKSYSPQKTRTKAEKSLNIVAREIAKHHEEPPLNTKEVSDSIIIEDYLKYKYSQDPNEAIISCRNIISKENSKTTVGELFRRPHALSEKRIFVVALAAMVEVYQLWVHNTKLFEIRESVIKESEANYQIVLYLDPKKGPNSGKRYVGEARDINGIGYFKAQIVFHACFSSTKTLLEVCDIIKSCLVKTPFRHRTSLHSSLRALPSIGAPPTVPAILSLPAKPSLASIPKKQIKRVIELSDSSEEEEENTPRVGPSDQEQDDDVMIGKRVNNKIWEMKETQIIQQNKESRAGYSYF